MAVRIHLFLSCVALFICTLSNIKAYRLSQAMSQYGNFSWKDCNNTSKPAHIHSFSMLPDPAKLPGNLSISTTFTLTSAIPSDVSLAVVMEKKVASFFVKVPCIDQIGSCMYPNMCELWTKICPKLNGNGNIPCNCPIPPGNYTANNIIIGLNFPGTIYTGDFRVTGRFVSPTGGEISCVQFFMTMA